MLKGIYAMKFQKPSKIQERALPLLLQNPCVRVSLPWHSVLLPRSPPTDLSWLDMRFVHTRPQNMIGQSQSGTGKTAAFTLTMLSRTDFSLQKTQVRSFPVPLRRVPHPEN